MTEQMKYAACVFLYSPNNQKVLAVSRKDNHMDFGLPGGKIEEMETAYDASVRELFEETGYMIPNLSPFFIYKVNGYLTTTFLPNCKIEELEDLISSSLAGKPVEGETGLVSWVSPEILVESSSFADYNLKLMQLLWSTKAVNFNIDELLGRDEVDFEICRVPNHRTSF